MSLLLTFTLLALMVLCLIIVEAFFSGSETAFFSVNRPKLFKQSKDKIKNAALAKELLSKPELVFSTTIVGTTLAVCTNTTLVTLFLTRRLEIQNEWINPLILTPLILIFGEFVPKLAGRANADRLVLKIAKPLKLASYLLYPLTQTLGVYAFLLKKLLGETNDKSFFISREEIKASLPASRGTDVTHSERVLISRILEFGKINVKEMLRPLIDVIAIEENETLESAVKLFNESGHSRLPVYKDRIDCIVGVIQGFDCLRAKDLSLTVKSAMQPPLFVPESKPLDELLSELKSKPMAIAVNEYGGAEGIVTMEDVMEELVGEIEDEFDEPPKLFRQISENSFIVNARMEIDDLTEMIKIPIPEADDYQTLAGFLLKRMQKIPKKWDSAIIDGVEYVIQSSTDRSIEEVYIILPKKK